MNNMTRPPEPTSVYWIGPVSPENAQPLDTWDNNGHIQIAREGQDGKIYWETILGPISLPMFYEGEYE